MSFRRIGSFILPSSLAASAALIGIACGSSARPTFAEEADVGVENPDFAEAGADAPAVEAAEDPTTCAEAADAKSYVGCDYWPTVTPNLVASVFDFAVVVANVGKEEANIEVTGPEGTNESVTVASGALQIVYLPWVSDLKGPESGTAASAIVRGGAFHLVSDRPVVVYQFNPLEFEAKGGPSGKDWSECVPADFFSDDCYSYSNDASLLLPSTAMTGAYRLMGSAGWTRSPSGFSGGTKLGANATITATQDGTAVKVTLAAAATVAAGTDIMAGNPGETLEFTLDAGDVALLTTAPGNEYDLSGSLLLADKPVQLITGVPCIDQPMDVQACDHIEEAVFPAETLGKHYVVMTPTGPRTNDVGHVVRFVGNADNTQLTYTPNKPKNCPATINAGEVVDCGVVETDFEVNGSEAFGVVTLQLGGEVADDEYKDGEYPWGDPSQSFSVAVEQYRKHYVFLAPTDYKVNFVDIVATAEDTVIDLDGDDVSNELRSLPGTSFFYARVELGRGKRGAHTLTASKGVGIQVIGYGDNTSYQFPGGLNLGRITAPPVK